MKSKIGKIAFITFDVIVLALFGFYLAISLKYRSIDEEARADFKAQSLLANGTSNGGSGGSSSLATGCAVYTTTSNWSIGDTHSALRVLYPSSASDTTTYSVTGTCTISGSNVTCVSKGNCTISGRLNRAGINCVSTTITCSCTEWTGPTTVSNFDTTDFGYQTKNWAESNNGNVCIYSV